MLFIILLSLFVQQNDFQEIKRVEFFVWNGYTHEKYLDSIWINPGALLESISFEDPIILLPNTDGLYKFKTPENSFRLRAKDNFAEMEIQGLLEPEASKITIDSLHIYPYHGMDTVRTFIWTKRKFLWFKWRKFSETSTVTPFGDTN